MKTYHIGTYFNYYEDFHRKHNTLNFCKLYPDIHLIQGIYKGQEPLNVENTTIYYIDSVGFIDYYLINKWRKDKKEKDYNLVIYDTDLILPEGYYSLIEDKLKVYDFVSGFGECYDVVNGVVVNKMIPNAYKYGYGHCGFIYGYSSWLLNEMVQFSEYFLIGGYDWFIYCCMTRKKPPIKLCYYEEIFKDVKYSYVDCVIYNNVHRNGILTDFRLYSKLSRELILSFMKKRILIV